MAELSLCKYTFPRLNAWLNYLYLSHLILPRHMEKIKALIPSAHCDRTQANSAMPSETHILWEQKNYDYCCFPPDHGHRISLPLSLLTFYIVTTSWIGRREKKQNKCWNGKDQEREITFKMFHPSPCCFRVLPASARGYYNMTYQLKT